MGQPSQSSRSFAKPTHVSSWILKGYDTGFSLSSLSVLRAGHERHKSMSEDVSKILHIIK